MKKESKHKARFYTILMYILIVCILCTFLIVASFAEEVAVPSQEPPVTELPPTTTVDTQLPIVDNAIIEEVGSANPQTAAVEPQLPIVDNASIEEAESANPQTAAVEPQLPIVDNASSGEADSEYPPAAETNQQLPIENDKNSEEANSEVLENIVIPENSALPTPSASPIIGEYKVRYIMREDGAGKLSFGSINIVVGEKIGKSGIPSVALTDGYELAGYVINEGGKVYSKTELAEYVPQANIVVKVCSKAKAAEPQPTVEPEVDSQLPIAAGEDGEEAAKKSTPTALVDSQTPIAANEDAEEAAKKSTPTVLVDSRLPIAADENTDEAATKYLPTVIIDPLVPIEDDENGEEADWEYPPGWVGSGQEYMDGNLVLASACKNIEVQLNAHLESMQNVLNMTGNVSVIDNEEDNMCAVLAVYAVKTGQIDDFPIGVDVETEQDLQALRDIFWRMTKVSEVVNREGSTINIERLSIDQAALALELSDEQKIEAESLLTDENEKVQKLLSESIFAKLSDSDYQKVIDSIPDGISAERRAVLMAALSLEGKVSYFWGGKSTYTGWDDRWGELRTVTGTGSKTYGTARPMGLDCSGFVSWAFINAGGDKDVLAHIGNGTANQYKSSYAVDWNDAKPGDLVFYKKPTDAGTNHVGVVISVNEDGSPNEIVHCSSSNNGVVITGTRGFKMVRRPYIYGE